MRKGTQVTLLLLAWFVLLCGVPLDVSAEFYADVYTGAVFTNQNDLTVTSTSGSTITHQNMSVNDTWTAGGRTGYWFDKMDWLGFGLDVFFFHAKAPTQLVPSTVTGMGPPTTTLTPVDWSLPVYGIGFDVLRLRVPLLRSEAFAHGRLQPYISAGPALFITYASTPITVQPKDQHDVDVAVGAKVDGGVTFLLTKRIGLFTQYRFTHFTSDLSYQNTTPGPATETFQTTYDSHHIIAGLTFQFP